MKYLPRALLLASVLTLSACEPEAPSLTGPIGPTTPEVQLSVTSSPTGAEVNLAVLVEGSYQALIFSGETPLLLDAAALDSIAVPVDSVATQSVLLRVTTTLEGYEPDVREVELIDGEPTTVDVTLIAIEQETTSLQVTSDPSTAELSIFFGEKGEGGFVYPNDPDVVSTTPFLSDTLPAGPVRIVLAADGFASDTTEVELSLGEQVIVDRTLRKLAATLVITANSEHEELVNASFTISSAGDVIAGGITPATLEDLPLGVELSITVSASRYLPWQTTVELSDGELKEVEAELQCDTVPVELNGAGVSRLNPRVVVGAVEVPPGVGFAFLRARFDENTPAGKWVAAALQRSGGGDDFFQIDGIGSCPLVEISPGVPIPFGDTVLADWDRRQLVLFHPDFVICEGEIPIVQPDVSATLQSAECCFHN